MKNSSEEFSEFVSSGAISRQESKRESIVSHARAYVLM